VIFVRTIENGVVVNVLKAQGRKGKDEEGRGEEREGGVEEGRKGEREEMKRGRKGEVAQRVERSVRKPR